MTMVGSSFALLHLLLLLSLCYQSSVTANNNETDRLALLEFKSGITYDPFGVMATWNNSVHFCHWKGVSCGHRHQRVSVLNLGSNRLAGSISPHIGNLSFLRILVLENNSFTGQIPRELGRLHRLQSLYLVGNRLGGRIPYSLGQLTNLKKFVLGDNGFEGTIPSSIFNLSSIETFGVYQNRLHGGLPLDLGILFPNLEYFGIFDNLFTGIIPPSISNASNLQRIVISTNKLRGQVPDLDNLHKLEQLVIADNNLGSGREGDLRFISSLTNATSLKYLYISKNNFGGTLPDSLANLSSITQIGISENQIVGRLPAGITNLKNLEVFVAYINQLSGSIPEDIGKLQSLHKLELHRNQFIGNIPASIGNLGNLITLRLDENKLQGSIPSSLGKCQSLTQLAIGDNSISGTIPSTLFTISSLSLALDLSRNKLTGSLPMEIGNLINLGQFGVSGNLLTGEIPSGLGSCTSLEFLAMDGNFFHGTIPSSLAALRGLQYLNLSHNNLSGEVPTFLGGFALEELDLSYNNFSGSLPNGGILKDASAVSVEGNSMLCGGASPGLHLPMCTSRNRKKTGMTLKMKITIGIVLSSIAAFLVFISLMFWLLQKKGKRDAPSTSSENFLLQVSYQTLFRATEGFSSTNLVGTGSFGSVYKGNLLGTHRMVAVKVFHLQQRGASKSFMAECDALRNVRHRNLLKVITACSSIDSCGDDFKAIVYEFMDNGNLDQWLHMAIGSGCTHEPPRKLNLLQRLNIAIDIACALDYLHGQYGQAPIVHCDLKPTNILLNDEMTALVGDFGLMKFLSESTSIFPTGQTSTTGLRGTIGYAAPEYGTGSEVSTYGDMYSYGILLLEMLTARKPTDDMFNNDLDLRNYVKMALPSQVTGVADPILVQEAQDNVGDSKKYQKVMEVLALILGIGIACSEKSPRERMNIRDALAKLILIRDKQILL